MFYLTIWDGEHVIKPRAEVREGGGVGAFSAATAESKPHYFAALEQVIEGQTVRVHLYANGAHLVSYVLQLDEDALSDALRVARILTETIDGRARVPVWGAPAVDLARRTGATLYMLGDEESDTSPVTVAEVERCNYPRNLLFTLTSKEGQR